ncbi:hypothetical protein Leryth_007780 [Lithospermum erythrorhizon]|nr:hypothetical protein Leryth_007780 [Lithospermum erythrorhizon]
MPPPPETTTTSAAERVILRWDSTASEDARDRMIFDADRDEITTYLQAVAHLHQSKAATSALQIAMARLEDEFRNILVTHSSPTILDNNTSNYELNDIESVNCEEEDDEHSKGFEHQETGDSGSTLSCKGSTLSCKSSTLSFRSSTSIREIELVKADFVCDLRSIAEVMIDCGYSRECVQVYGSVRKLSVEASFSKLGIEKLSIGDIQRLDWDTLETKIRRWIRAAKVCIRMVFSSEKRLCEQIFEGLGIGTDDSCFMETIKGPAVQLFNFAEAISISRRAPEKLFKILDLHDALSDLLPDIEIVFDSMSSESIRVQAEEILSRLAEAVRGILSEFENKVLSEPSKVPVPGGTIHPLTRYVMNYISLISDYKDTLDELVVSKPSTGGRYWGDTNFLDLDFSEMENQSPLALHLIWMIAILQCNLEGKSKCYKDASIAHLFMMNNVHYIAHKIKGSPELREMIEDNYLRRLTGKFRSAATNYQRSTWVRVLHCLRDEGLHVKGGFSSGVSKSALRDRFKSFNAIFEDVHRTQATWLVPDIQLREELRISISELLIPAYRSFLGRFRGHIESGA